MAEISQAAIDLIVAEEVSSRATYEKKYQRPEWPGGASGITIAIGYDVGYATPAKLRSDWAGRIPDAMIRALEQCCGVHGEAAHTMLAEVRPQVLVPWDAAMAVFSSIDVPQWAARCRKLLPNFDLLPPDCKGALTSIAYNRGASFATAGDRYTEMREIRAHMAAKRLDLIPAEIRSMKRLWTNGLVGRREREAKLFERGLANPAKGPLPKVPTAQDMARDKAAKTGGTIAVPAGGGGYLHSIETALLGLACAAGVALLVYWFASRHSRQPKADPVVPAAVLEGATQ